MKTLRSLIIFLFATTLLYCQEQHKDCTELEVICKNCTEEIVKEACMKTVKHNDGEICKKAKSQFNNICIGKE